MELFNFASGHTTTYSQSPIPKDAVRPGNKYQEQGFLINITQKTYLMIRVVNVEHPQCFFFQLYQNAERTDKLCKEMNKFYDSAEGNCYYIDEYDCADYLPVAAVYRNGNSKSWQRGEIVPGSLKDMQAEVYFVDLGIKCLVPLTEIRLIRDDYFVLQKQAIPAALACVKPIHGCEWSFQAVEKIRAFVVDGQPLMAEIVGSVGDSVALMITKVSEDEDGVDLHLTDVLIKENLAMAADLPQPLKFYPPSAFNLRQCYSSG